MRLSSRLSTLRIVALALLLPSSVAVAQRAPARAPSPCTGDADHHRFDFWIGEWDVTDPTGSAHVGTSSIQSVSGGCALLENWTGARGGQGKSLSAFNPAIGQWQQYWIGSDGRPTEFRESSWSEGSLVLRAHATTANGPAELRLTFTPVDSLTVRQHGERSTDGGATWTTTYDFYYHRKR